VNGEDQRRRELLPRLGLSLVVEHDHRYLRRRARALIQLPEHAVLLDQADQRALAIGRRADQRRALAVDRSEARVLDPQQIVRDTAHDPTAPVVRLQNVHGAFSAASTRGAQLGRPARKAVALTPAPTCAKRE
jgi:hypothetical protein